MESVAWPKLLAGTVAFGIALYVLSWGLRRAGGPPGAAGPFAEQAARLSAMLVELGYESRGGSGGDGPATSHHVRRHGDVTIHHETSSEWTGHHMARAVTWRAELPHPAPVPIHVADRSVAEASGRLAQEIGLRRVQAWAPAWKTRVESGDPAFDTRFRAFSPDPAAARALLSDEDLRARLLTLPYVDVVVDGASAVFSDPFQRALLGRLGGATAGPSLLTDAGIEAQRALHLEIAALLSVLSGLGPDGRAPSAPR